jgi:hypothetical protein
MDQYLLVLQTHGQIRLVRLVRLVATVRTPQTQQQLMRQEEKVILAQREIVVRLQAHQLPHREERVVLVVMGAEL